MIAICHPNNPTGSIVSEVNIRKIIVDLNSEGYSFSNNYLSDLGRIKTVAGMDNSIPFYCFNSALIILSVVFSFYFLFLPSVYDESIEIQNIARVGRLLMHG